MIIRKLILYLMLYFWTGFDNSRFHVIFSNIDNLKGTHMLYLSSMGIAASRQTTTADSTASQIVAKVDVESSEDEEHPEDG